MFKKILASLVIFVLILLVGFVIKKISAKSESRAKQKEMERVWAIRDAFYARFPPRDTIAGRIAILRDFDEKYPSIEAMSASLAELSQIAKQTPTVDFSSRESVAAQRQRLRDKLLFDVFDPVINLEVSEVYHLVFSPKLSKIDSPLNNSETTSPENEIYRQECDKVGEKLMYLKNHYLMQAKTPFIILEQAR